jgi:hypothetical protein
MSNATLTIDIDARKLFAAFARIPQETEKQLRIALKESLILVKVDAKQNHSFKSHSHNLENSVQIKVDNTSNLGSGSEGFGISGIVYLEKQVAPYAAAVHNGSKPHVIEPKERKALHWVSKGKEFFSTKVNHPGYKGDPFLNKALVRKTPEIKRKVQEAVHKIFQMAGLK